MSGRGIDFLENWVNKNVTAADKGGINMRALVLANHCIAEAAAQGLTLNEIVPEQGSVESIISEAIAHLAEPGTPGD